MAVGLADLLRLRSGVGQVRRLNLLAELAQLGGELVLLGFDLGGVSLIVHSGNLAEPGADFDLSGFGPLLGGHAVSITLAFPIIRPSNRLDTACQPS